MPVWVTTLHTFLNAFLGTFAKRKTTAHAGPGSARRLLSRLCFLWNPFRPTLQLLKTLLCRLHARLGDHTAHLPRCLPRHLRQERDDHTLTKLSGQGSAASGSYICCTSSYRVVTTPLCNMLFPWLQNLSWPGFLLVLTTLQITRVPATTVFQGSCSLHTCLPFLDYMCWWQKPSLVVFMFPRPCKGPETDNQQLLN